MMSGRTRRREREREPSTDPNVGLECDVVYGTDEARVSVRGGLDLETVATLRRTVLAAAALPIAQVTVDLAGVESMDRHSVNVLMALRDQVIERSTRFMLASESPSACRALESAGSWQLFEHRSIWSDYPPSEGSARPATVPSPSL